MGRMRSQLDDLMAQQAQNAADVSRNVGNAPQYRPATYEQPYQEQQAAPYPQATPYPHQPQMATQPQYAQQSYPAGPEGGDVSAIKFSLERLAGQLNELTQSQNTPTRKQPGIQSNTMPDMQQEFAALRREIATLSSATANSPVGNEIYGSIKLIAEGMRQLQLLQGEQPAQFGQFSSSLQAIHSQLDQLNRSGSQGATQVDLTPLQNDMESNFAALGQRLEMMTSDQNQIGELTQAIDGSHADIVSRLHALAEHSPAENVSDMRAQLQNIATTLSGLSNSGGSASGSDISSMEKRLDDITHGMVALSVNVNESSNQEALERVEARVATLAKTVDTFVAKGASGKPEGNDETLHVLHSLTGHIDVLSDKIDGLSVVPAGKKGEQAAFVRNDDGIIKKLDLLVSRMDDLQAGGTGAGDDKNLIALEKQLSDIASHMGSGGGGTIDFSHLDERLDTIEQQVAVSRDIAIEVASKVAGEAANNAAVQAVNETFNRANIGGEQGGEHGGGPVIDAEIYNNIADDIRKLQNATLSQDTNNRQVFDSVRDSLNTIISRLGDIEGMVATGGNNSPVARQVLAAQLEAKSQAASAAVDAPDPQPNKRARAPLVEAKGEEVIAVSKDEPNYGAEPVRSQGYPDASAGPEIVPPSLDIKDLPEVDDTPMEPGSGGPDLAALVQQANKRKKEEPETEEVTGTDFIAAARRAAQAAALEANAAEAEEKTKAKSKSSFSLSEFFAKRKKVVLMTAAAVLIAAMAVPIATAFLNGDGIDKLAGFGEPAEQSAILPTTSMQQQMPITGIDLETVGSISRSVESDTSISTPTIMKMPMGNETMNDNHSTDGFAVGNSLVDSSVFAAKKPMEMATKAGTEITKAPMPASNVGNILLRQAAARGNLSALFEVGRIYTDGNGIERNLTEAAKWYRLAAERGHGPAQYRLGNFYEKGHGMARNIDEAMVWYRLAAKQGNALAMHNLAVVTAMGTNNAKADLNTAAGWFEKAAELGIKDSQVNLGILYTKGLGVEKDLVAAYKWFGVASQAGDSDASSKRDTVSGLMTKDQLQHGRAEIELWKKTPINDGANFVEIPSEWKGNALANGKQSKRNAIRDTQLLLSKLGFDAGPADGMMGAKTRNAVMAFQQRTGMTVDGKISSGLIAKLRSGAA